MRFSELQPAPMRRVAVVAPTSRRREAMVALADAGALEVDHFDEHRRDGRSRGELDRLLRDAPEDVRPRLCVEEPDVEALREREAWDLLAGEADIADHVDAVTEHGPASVLLGWMPAEAIDEVSARLAEHGTSVVELPRPKWIEPPTRMTDIGLRGSVRPLVRTYAVVPYEDVDPSLFAAVTYVAMFGMMFGDVGHGLVLALLGLLLARTGHPRLVPFRRLWVFPVAAGAVAAVFGLLYGEAFGPTGLVPELWLSPLDEPTRLLAVAIGVGAVLIAVSYVIGSVNRWREGGLGLALYSSSGLAGVAVFVGLALLAGGVAYGPTGLLAAGAAVTGVGLVLTFVGFRAEAGEGGAGLGQALIEVFDTVVRIFANVVSFGRLAAFGLTHAALGFAVWEGTTALWGSGPTVVGAVLAVLVFLVGNALTFALEALVVAVQALRLEYYELFSRIFSGEGRLFDPWHVPLATEERS